MTTWITGPGVLRACLLFEGAVNILMGGPYVVNPENTLQHVLQNPADINPGSIALSRMVGMPLVTKALPLFMSFPDTPDAGAKRRQIYWLLLAGEFFHLVVLGRNLLDTNPSKGMSDAHSISLMKAIGSFAAVRMFFMFIKPEWLDPPAKVGKVE